MARNNNLFYNQPGIAVIIDGVPGADFADDFAFKVEFPDDMAETVVGLDKSSTSISSDRTATVTVAYKPTSPGLDQFYQLYVNQREGRGRVFNVSCTTGVNERINMNRCAIKSLGDIETGGKTMAMREIVMTCEEFTPDQSLF